MSSLTMSPSRDGDCPTSSTTASRNLKQKASFTEIRSLMMETTPEVMSDASETHSLSQFRVKRALSDPVSVCEHPSPSEKTSVSDQESDRSRPVVGGLKKTNSLALGRQFSNRHRQQAPLCQEIPMKAPLVLSRRESERLRRDCERGIEFLIRLQEPITTRRLPSTEPALPKTALRFSKGLAFMWQRKAGFLGSWVWGHGFVIARLGPYKWSAPCFLKDRFLSVGFTAGFRTLDTVYAIPSEEGLRPFDTDYLRASLDFAATLDFDPVDSDAPIAVRLSDRKLPDVNPLATVTDEPKAYTIADGAIMDLSWRIGLHMVNDARNEVLYGPGTTPQQILEGEVPFPEEFLPLYNAISQLASSAHVVRDTVSEFDLAKEREKLKKGSWLGPRVAAGSSQNSMNAVSINTASINTASLGFSDRSNFTVNSLSESPRTVGEEPKQLEKPFQLFPMLDLNLDDPLQKEEQAA